MNGFICSETGVECPHIWVSSEKRKPCEKCAEPKNDFNKVRKYVSDHGYEPQNIPMNQFVASILLHLDGICENEDCDISVDDFLDRFSEYGRFEDYDY